MKKLHEKSACCRAGVIKYGNKRRQCVGCRRTWSVWKKRRGRKRKRIDADFVRAFLGREIASLAAVAKKRGYSEAHMQDVLRRSCEHFVRTTSWPTVPEGNLILVADAVIERIERQWRTVYLMLARSVTGTEAIILPPLMLPGTETVPGWRMAMDTIPTPVMSRIQALVCDGHVGLVQEGFWRKWVIQRCHFHLLARIQSRRSRFRIARNKEEAVKIFARVRAVLSCTDAAVVNASLAALEEIGWNSTSPEIRKILSGFVKNYRDYRSYLTHSALHLPTTNNTAECLGSAIADLKQRMRGFPTLRSFERWITALLKFKKQIACNGFFQQNKLG